MKIKDITSKINVGTLSTNVYVREGAFGELHRIMEKGKDYLSTVDYLDKTVLSISIVDGGVVIHYK